MYVNTQNFTSSFHVSPTAHTRTHARTHTHTIFKIKEARLAHVLQLGTSLTDFSSLVPHSLPRTPAEGGKGTLADLALLAIFVFDLQKQTWSSPSMPQTLFVELQTPTHTHPHHPHRNKH